MPRNFRGISGIHHPGTSFEVNWNSPQVRGLHFWAPVLDSNGARFLVDKVLKLSGAFSAGAVINPDYERGYILYGGVNDYVTFSNPDVLDNLAVGKALTVTCWHWSTGNLAGTHVIVDKRDPGKGWRVYRNRITNQRISARTECAVTDAYSQAVVGTWIEDQWNHIAATYNDVGDRKWRIYINAVQPAYGTQTAGNGNAGTDETMALNIGDLDAGQGIAGRTSDVRIYARVLSDGEIYHLWAPDTRWDLYAPVKRIWPVVSAAPPADAMPMAMDTYRRRRIAA